jgi:hypothetical protein
MLHLQCHVAVEGTLMPSLAHRAVPADLLHAAAPPAGGAALDQILEASVIFTVVLGGLAWFVLRQRAGRSLSLTALADRMARAVGAPIWAALPLQLLRGSLLVALFGMYWDISLHIDRGRDAGPLANPAHWFILIGLAGVFSAGAISLALARDPLPGGTLRLSRHWRTPLGGTLILGCGAFSLLGFPLDDVWHRLFGQDVTLFGPTHLMLIGGAALSTLGGWLLLMEGVQVRGSGGRWVRFGEYGCAGGLLIGLSAFQAEFDFGVPQFRFVLEPVMVMAAASVALVIARIRLGRGGALAAVLVFLLVRGTITAIVALPLDRSVAHFPLYLVEALLVEGVALLAGTARTARFGALCGVAIGTAGLAAEWGWSHVWAVLPWPSALLPEAAVLGLVAAVGGGLVGGWAGARLDRTAGRPRPADGRGAARFAAPVGALAVVGCLAVALPMSSGAAVSADVTLREVTAAPQRTVLATVRLAPATAADDAAWFTATAWQGGGGVTDRLRRTGPGTWESTRPLPVHGDWKATLRLQRGTQVLALPVYLPRDDAIPAPGIAATSSFTRSFQLDKELMQREAKQGVPGSLWTLAYLVVGGLTLLALGCITGGLAYAARRARVPDEPVVQPADRAGVTV